MKNRNKVLCILFLTITLNLFAQKQQQSNIIGIGIGMSPGRDYCYYFGDPIDEWAGKKASPIFHVFYARQVLEAVRLGGYFEYESGTLINLDGADDFKASRLNIGFNWLAQYPNNSLHMQLGGYVGFGFVNSENLDNNLKGIDFGIMVGPAYEIDNYGVALHFQSGMGWYSSSDLDDLNLLMPRILLKVYHKF